MEHDTIKTDIIRYYLLLMDSPLLSSLEDGDDHFEF